MIPVSEPLIGDNTHARVLDCLNTGWVSSEGKYITKFEEQWATYCDARYGIAVANGTCALQIAVKALRLEPGSEIILPSFTIISCAMAILEAGCKPVLVDACPDTWNMATEQIEKKITPRTRAIMVVHMFGHPVDMDAVGMLAQRYNLRVIEDAAEAHGAEFRSRKVGGIGDVACFSFYANKIITTGEGGMLTTSDPDIAEHSRSLRNLCFRKDRRFKHVELGYNFRLTNLQAAVGLAQIERIESHIAHKRWLSAEYTQRLRHLPISLPVERAWAKSVYWMYGIVLNDNVPYDASIFASLLRDKGVDTRPLFLGMHEQPVFSEMGLFSGEVYPVTERLARRGLYIPSGLALNLLQIEEVASVVNDLLAPYSRA